ncbi:MAG: sorbosone dehydrogenase family protein [Anaerolineales bacterium]|nr:sorbosone dehydrogenase family protein [Anaerolineales bacterium]
MSKKRITFIVFFLLCGVLVTAVYLYRRLNPPVNLVGSLGGGDIASLTLPPGFEANVFASGLSGPRFIAFGPDGALYVADRGNGRIATLPDTNQDGVADAIHTFADGLTQPHSLTYHEGAWYVGVPTGVIRLVDENGDGTADSRETLIDDYPTNGHSTRTVLFLTDGRMVVSVGSSCNVCEEDDPRRAAVLVYDDGNATNEQIFASGLRNAVGLALHPQTGELWATNNGRDMLGDNTPPETVYIVREGEAYGWPVCHSGDIIDPDLGHAGDCDGVTAPIVEMQAHSAPLGLAFYTGTQFPAEYQGDLFVAFHGSWNRREPTGYKVVRIPLNGSTPTGAVEDFATGWLSLEENVVYGRPVGLAVGPDGALYVSDDKGGYIYRISYRGS